ncbi:MAG: nucleoside deaminase [Bacteroidales bacterium]|nr:nucleoside deaminase [Bacteroidales bacterium]MCF8343632.1 nucleoside deaminase [Bacteroidales bacterium]MCF8350118.1 nucleoside deaminase [Bacteroidales bacterium]MCF8376176.1 nucleoside deaminase [Bacteroidales bacterium]MCF8401158.1 nucleoside deaminase [Bacteroidales bacterium]
MVFSVFSDAYYMKEALKEAEKAFELDEVPVGAIVVVDNYIIARSHNLTERLMDVTAHAEMQVITAAANHIGGKYLTDCTLFVTVEPCLMCATAMHWAQLGKLVYGAQDPKKGFSNYGDKILHPQTEVVQGFKHKECAELMARFFKGKRD